jgi:hypothetical protein
MVLSGRNRKTGKQEKNRKQENRKLKSRVLDKCENR